MGSEMCIRDSNNRVRIKVSIRVRVRVSFTTGAVRPAILATAGLLVKGRDGNNINSGPSLIYPQPTLVTRIY